eukprot:TRINITY_DN3060_c0_g1_i7.p1 TRINITY_DN3060_c0_g1~~TRINITY_DN3060_c0_g1_i7.p1  ORF type:complete len:905 (+),score=192.01 TRINITY_DN3060_c0_g1_i7:212-2716(+)
MVELNYGHTILNCIKDSSKKDMQTSYLYALSDLVDVDESAVLGSHFLKLRAVEEILKVLRSTDSSSDFELQSAGVCALSSLCLHDMDHTTKLMDHREIKMLDNILQMKSMTHLHARVVTFINNIYVTGKFQTLLSLYTIPSIMALLMYNVTNHIKIRKARQEMEDEDSEESAELSGSEEGEEDVFEDYKRTNLASDSTLPNKRPRVTSRGDYEFSNVREQRILKQKQDKLQSQIAKQQQRQQQQQPGPETTRKVTQGGEEDTKTVTGPTEEESEEEKGLGTKLAGSISDISGNTSHVSRGEATTNDFEADPLYDDEFYNEFIESACLLLGNLTTSGEICTLTEQFSIIDIMTLLFHNTDTTLDALTSVIKCLANLAHLKANQGALVEANILPISLKFMKLNVDDEMKAQITILLANLSGHEDCTQIMIEGGAIESIAQLLQSNSHVHQRFASLALANIAIEVTAIPHMVTHCMKRVVELCYSSQPYVRRQATRILNSIASYPTGMYWGALIDAGAVLALKNVMHVHDHTASPEHPSAHDLAKTAMAYIEGTVVASVPSSIPNIQINANLPTVKPNPTEALIEKDAGNELFLAGRYVDSIIRYTRAIEYDPENYAFYSNRAAAYMHLSQWELALKDSDVCIRLAPEFVKAHFRRGKALVGLAQYAAAVDAFTTALKLKKDNKEIRDVLQLANSRKKDNIAVMPLSFHKMSLYETLKCLDNPALRNDIAYLLTHLFQLFKRLYSSNLDTWSQNVLLGNVHVSTIVALLTNWSSRVPLDKLMSIPGTANLIFESDLVTERLKQRRATFVAKANQAQAQAQAQAQSQDRNKAQDRISS